MQPMLVLTKIDEISADLRTCPNMEHALLKEKVTKVAAETRIPEMLVFPSLGYILERQNNIYVDRFALDLLFTAMQIVTQANTQP